MSTNWQSVALDALVERRTVKNAVGDANVLTISARHGLVSQREFFNKQVASKELGHYFFLERGDFAYNKSYSDGYPVGAIKRLDKHATGVVSPLYICFRIKDAERVCSDFLVHYFEAGLLETGLRSIAKEGARNHGLLNVKPSEFFALSLQVPPLDVQRKIAAILSSVDASIKATQAVIDQLQIVKKAMMAELLTHGLPGRHTLFKQTELGELPEEWEVLPFEQLLAEGDSLSYGILQPGDDDPCGVPMLRTVDLDEHGGRSETVVLRVNRLIEAQYERTRLRGGEVLLSVMGTVGRTVVVPPEWSGWNVNRALAVVRVNGTVAADFLGFWIRSPSTQDRFAVEQIGSAQKRVNLGDLRKMLVPVPEAEEQAKLCTVFAACERRLSDESRVLAELRTFKSALMSALLTGEVRVKREEEVA